MVLESRTQTGRHGEAWAIQALTTPSRQLLSANWRWRRHEIDAVFMELDTVVFLEVKSRTGCGTNLRLDLHMPGAAQQKRIVKAANAFMKRHGMHAMECRFDVAAVRVHPSTVKLPTSPMSLMHSMGPKPFFPVLLAGVGERCHDPICDLPLWHHETEP